MNSTVKYCKEKKGYKEELCEQKVCIITSSTMAGYKDGDKVMHNIILNMV